MSEYLPEPEEKAYFEPDYTPQQPRFDPATVKLEKRGITSQLKQAPLWASEVVFQQSILSKLKTIGKISVAGKMAECHTIETFKQCCSCQKVSKFFNRCDLFFCPVCAPRLSRERKEEVEWWTKEIKQPKHLVLTVRNTNQLTKKYVQFLKKQFSNLRRSRAWLSVRGGFYRIETTNESRGWHLHFHILCDSNWLQISAISQVWAKLVGQDFAICKIKDCRKADYLAEVTKYVVKGSQLAGWSAEDIATFIDAFSGVRTFGVFGSLYGKRTDWAEWIRTIKEYRPVCSCGCDSYRLCSPEDFEWNQIVNEDHSATSPPRLAQVPINQLDLALDGTRSFIWH